MPAMQSRISFVLLTSAVVLAIGALFFGTHRASSAGSGPTMVVGTPSLASGKVQIPINAVGSTFDPYAGFNVHLRWDLSVFSFSSANDSGTVLTSPFCAPPLVDGDSAGVVYACTGLGGPSTTAGLLGTILLTPAASGCSALHLFTLGPPDGGDAGNGTYTVNAADDTPQSNA